MFMHGRGNVVCTYMTLNDDRLVCYNFTISKLKINHKQCCLTTYNDKTKFAVQQVLVRLK